MNNAIVYINFPFQGKLIDNKSEIVSYHQALRTEIERYILQKNCPMVLDAVYLDLNIFEYPIDLLLDIIGILKKGYCLNQAEISVQVEAGNFSVDYGAVLKEAGVNRFNVVVRDRYDDVVISSWLKKVSQYCYNIAVDFVFDAQSLTSVACKQIVGEFVSDVVQHCSMQFIVDDAIGVKTKGNASASFYYQMTELLEDKELYCYEYFHYARDGYKSRYMSAYWNRAMCIGFGAGAHSFDGLVRYANKANVQQYVSCVNNNESQVDFFEELLSRNIFLEKLMVGMRQPQGFVVEDLLQYLWESERKKFLVQLDFLVSAQLMYCKNGKAGLQRSALFLEQEIIKKLLV